MEYQIPACNASVFEKKVSFLRKRAAKCNVAFDMTRNDDSAMKHPDRERAKKGEVVVIQNYTITADTPVIEGYTLIGTLDHKSVPGSVLVNSVPGESVPHDYQSCDRNVCDHCNKRRNRKLSIVMRNESGQHIVVGRSCVRDFIGYDIDATVKYLEYLRALDGLRAGECDFECGYGSAYGYSFDVESVLTQTAAIVRREGYHNANYEGTTTREKVWDCFVEPTFHGKFAAQQLRNYLAWRDDVKPTDADADMAAKAMAWIADENADENNYLHNLQTIVAGGAVVDKTMGYTVSLISTYERAALHAERQRVERDIAEQAADCPTGRMSIRGAVISVKLQETAFGETLKMLLRTDQGYKLWGSVPSAINDVDDLRGLTVEFTARIEPSRDDKKFGFFTRPTKASVIETATA